MKGGRVNENEVNIVLSSRFSDCCALLLYTSEYEDAACVECFLKYILCFLPGSLKASHGSEGSWLF